MNEISDSLEIDWDVYEPGYCPSCGHFHSEFVSCPDEPSIPCGDYRCCIN